jgi:hypothetical protein
MFEFFAVLRENMFEAESATANSRIFKNNREKTAKKPRKDGTVDYNSIYGICGGVDIRAPNRGVLFNGVL